MLVAQNLLFEAFFLRFGFKRLDMLLEYLGFYNSIFNFILLLLDLLFKPSFRIGTSFISWFGDFIKYILILKTYGLHCVKH